MIPVCNEYNEWMFLDFRLFSVQFLLRPIHVKHCYVSVLLLSALLFVKTSFIITDNYCAVSPVRCACVTVSDHSISKASS